MPLQDHWRSVEAAFFHPQLRKNRILIRQARLMFVTCAVGGAGFLFVILAASFGRPPGAATQQLLLLGHGITCASMFTLRFFPTMKVPSRVMASTLCLQLVGAAILTGGLESSTLYQFPLAAVFLGLVGGIRESVGTAAFLVTSVVLLWLAHEAGVDLTEGRSQPAVQMASLSLSCLLGGGIALFMALQARKLLDLLDRELEARKVAQQRAESANQTKNLYMAFLSHEIRNPLQVILANVELYGEPDLDDADRALCVESIEAASRGLSGMLQDVLTFAALERRGILVRQDEVELAPLLEEVVAMHRESARQRGLTLTLTQPPTPRVLGDVHRLRQVLSNLLSNAIKYTPSGSVRVETRLEEGRLSIHVIDTGPGISAALRETIFRPFERSKQETVEGTGIGLAVCHGLVTRMGGRLQLHSDEGSGSDFFFDLAVPEPTG